MAQLHLTCGAIALIDDADLALVSRWSWRAHPTEAGRVYVARSAGGTRHYLHRVILGAGPRQTVDHANGDTLDNRRANLRFCSASQNAANTPRPAGSSGLRGVYRHRAKWRAIIQFEHRREFLGIFADRTDAARAYDAAARRIHGAFAILNFPVGP